MSRQLKNASSFLAGLLVAIAVGAALAQTTGGLPSRPKFQTVEARAARTNAAAPITTRSASAAMRWNETDQAADTKQWELAVTGSQFLGRTLDDAGAAVANWLNVSRSGSTPSNATIAIGAHSLDVTTSRAAINSTAPRFFFNETDAAANETIYQCASAAGQFTCASRTDADGAGANWLLVDRTGTTIDLVNLTGTAVQANGVAIATTASGTFTASFDLACTTTPTITFDYVQNGNIVTIFPNATAGFTCTGDSTSFATTGAPVPAAIRPAFTVNSPAYDNFLNNNAAAWAKFSISTAGDVTFHICTALTAACNSTGWTASGNRQAGAFLPVTYMLGNP